MSLLTKALIDLQPCNTFDLCNYNFPPNNVQFELIRWNPELSCTLGIKEGWWFF